MGDGAAGLSLFSVNVQSLSFTSPSRSVILQPRSCLPSGSIKRSGSGPSAASL